MAGSALPIDEAIFQITQCQLNSNDGTARPRVSGLNDGVGVENVTRKWQKTNKDATITLSRYTWTLLFPSLLPYQLVLDLQNGVMVNSNSGSLLNDPVGAILAAFTEATLTTRPTATNDYEIPHIFEETFAEDSEIAKIPLLRGIDLNNLQEASSRLFRTICYVTHSDSEIYGGAFRSSGAWHLGRYGQDATDLMPEHNDDGDLVFEERISLQCQLLSLLPEQGLETSLEDLSLESGNTVSHRRPEEVTIKLYNEAEDGLLHACLDVIGILETDGTNLILHSLITKSQRLSSIVSSGSSDIHIDELKDARADILQSLEAVLAGDALAAELILLSLTSSVAVRSPVLVGPLSLNLRNVNTTMAADLSKLVSELAATTFAFDMSIDNLNKSKLFPSHDGEDFSAGRLQLPTDSAVILNESALSEGELDQRGVKNVQCLTNSLNTQDLIFHFPFSEFKIPIDVSFIILSHGKSLLPSSISIALRPSSVWNLNIKTSKIQMRTYLARCRLQEVEISDSVSSRIQDDFVSKRKQGATTDQEDLSMSLALGKELARSHHRRMMTWEDYVRAAELRRKIVLAASP